jgi:Asp-tRNA(Asn)/Glu-tRNA(Gln) amidotransferase A subunit family amidase
MSGQPLNELCVAELSEHLSTGAISSEQVVRACLDRIDAREDVVKAWAFLNPEVALAQARERDAEDRRGPLHGVPVAIKDIIDTQDYPTEYGTPIYAGHQPTADASCVTMLKQAGAVIIGKTRTTELAAVHPTITTNPHNPGFTPGGSSAGSAAAVADNMVPAALGTQTFGSIIRPAGYCGAAAFKPTFGLVSRAGVKAEAEALDTVGAFCRSAKDMPLLLAGLTNHDPAAFEAEAPTNLRIGVCRGPGWSEVLPETVQAIDSAASALAAAGAEVVEFPVPALFEDALDAHYQVACYEISKAFAYEWAEHCELISNSLAPLIEHGETLSPAEYYGARGLGAQARIETAGRLAKVDAVLTPAQPGEAPKGLGWTGNPIFNRFWTFIGVPCVTLPAGKGPNGLPVGIQLVGRHEDEAGLFAVAAWAEALL